MPTPEPTTTTPAPGLTVRGGPLPRLADLRLAAFDMDSTLINIECVDEIADAAGRKAEVAAITEAAMRGEITDYKDSLRRRVALLRFSSKTCVTPAAFMASSCRPVSCSSVLTRAYPINMGEAQKRFFTHFRGRLP